MPLDLAASVPPEPPFDDTPAVIVAPIHLTVPNRDVVKHALLDYLAVRRQRHLVLDVSACGYIDASGLGMLITVAKRLNDAGGSLTLRGMHDDQRELLTVTGLATLFAIEIQLEHVVR